jgi:hypothetical protein
LRGGAKALDQNSRCGQTTRSSMSEELHERRPVKVVAKILAALFVAALLYVVASGPAIYFCYEAGDTGARHPVGEFKHPLLRRVFLPCWDYCLNQGWAYPVRQYHRWWVSLAAAGMPKDDPAAREERL